MVKRSCTRSSRVTVPPSRETFPCGSGGRSSKVSCSCDLTAVGTGFAGSGEVEAGLDSVCAHAKLHNPASATNWKKRAIPLDPEMLDADRTPKVTKLLKMQQINLP